MKAIQRQGTDIHHAVGQVNQVDFHIALRHPVSQYFTSDLAVFIGIAFIKKRNIKQIQVLNFDSKRRLRLVLFRRHSTKKIANPVHEFVQIPPALVGHFSEVYAAMGEAYLAEFQTIPKYRKEVARYTGAKFVDNKKGVSIQVLDIQPFQNNIVKKLYVQALYFHPCAELIGKVVRRFLHQPILYRRQL